MPLEVRPFEESDFPEFVRIQCEAFQNGMAYKLVPRPITQEWIQKTIDKMIKSFRTEPDCYFVKVVDTDMGDKFVAGAKWRINEKERTEEEIQGMLPKPGKDEEGNPGVQAFMKYLAEARKEHMGTKPFFLLHLIITDLEHQRRGAASMLINWGFERADKAGLQCYLEATEVGKPVYSKLGFYPVKVKTFDLTQYGGQGIDRSTIMLRDPVKL
ncbi:acyl-CoA N-acyltransferase [Lojkania enalia]|uniref:Acyl-CoA N-acyltransferase n=1 Tax=Lojkania enalia TaxID=147567 RepID=A0A9P4KBJ2_9PLEO|nr:acyl-CoA N-acyltransferase [Didymosphaeria enalia]